MLQVAGESRVKGLQKEFLQWVEVHPVLMRLPPSEFNGIRKKVFRATFEAFRLGIVGIDARDARPIWQYFFGWFDQQKGMNMLDAQTKLEVAERLFITTLEALRIGAMVS